MNDQTFSLRRDERVLVDHRTSGGEPVRTRGEYAGKFHVPEAGADWNGVILDGGITGGGPNGEYLVPDCDLEPLRLWIGAQVKITRNGGDFYSRVSQVNPNHTYSLEGDDGAHQREDIRLATFMDTPEVDPIASVPRMEDAERAQVQAEASFMNEGARLPSPLPNDSAARKLLPVYDVIFGCFPAAAVGVTRQAMKGQAQHNDGTSNVVHDRSKSRDHVNCIIRHLMEGDYEAVAWRALALLQEKLEEEGSAPIAPRAINA